VALNLARSAIFALVLYVLAVAVVPAVAFWATFVVMCRYECVALPYLSVLIGPGIGVACVIVLAIIIYRMAAWFDVDYRRRVHLTVWSSIFWGPPIAYGVFRMSTPLIGPLVDKLL
jgi:hypothetical protein